MNLSILVTQRKEIKRDWISNGEWRFKIIKAKGKKEESWKEAFFQMSLWDEWIGGESGGKVKRDGNHGERMLETCNFSCVFHSNSHSLESHEDWEFFIKGVVNFI